MPKISRKTRHTVAQRAKFLCEYCRAQELFSPDPFSVEHIIPLTKGGSNDLMNLAFACQGCNNHKYNKTEVWDVVTQQLIPIYNPRLDRWTEHFVWNNDYSQIIGITATGRATVEQLKMNRPGLMNLREVLLKLQKHPPKT